MDKETFDFWYAVNNTELVHMPSNQLETFGTTTLRYHLVSELMDSVDQVRVREGQIEAQRPQILTPQAYATDMLEGFGSEAQQYLEWLQQNESDLKILQYGFVISKTETNDHIITDHIDAIVDNVVEAVKARDDALAAVVIGVDEPWEVCLLKLLRDVVRDSAPGNIQDLQKAKLLGNPQDHLREQIENQFLAASKNPELIDSLGSFLQQNGMFAPYEDRFFALVQANKRRIEQS